MRDNSMQKIKVIITELVTMLKMYAQIGFHFIKMFVTLLSFTYIASLHGVTATIVDARVEPREKTVLKGETLNAMCRVNKSVAYCQWFGIDGETDRGHYIHQNATYFGGIKYYGRPENGECGITIPNVTAKYNRILTCKVTTFEPFVKFSSWNISVIVVEAPKAPQMKVIYPINPEYPPFEENQEIQVECKVEFGRPVANISWTIGTKLIKNRLSDPVIEDVGPEGEGLKTITQNYTRNLTYSDNGKEITCAAHHVALREETIANYKLNVYFSPRIKPEDKQCAFIIGQCEKVLVTILANPKPFVKWLVDGYEILEGDTAGRFQAAKLIETGETEWVAALDIMGTTPVEKNYTLIAENIRGKEKYTNMMSAFADITASISFPDVTNCPTLSPELKNYCSASRVAWPIAGAAIAIAIVIIILLATIMIIYFKSKRRSRSVVHVNTNITPEISYRWSKYEIPVEREKYF